MTAGTKQIVVGFYFKRRGQTTLWDLQRIDPEQAGQWRGPGAWPGAHDDRQAWINVGLEHRDDQDADDLVDDAQSLAEAELSRLYPGALVAK